MTRPDDATQSDDNAQEPGALPPEAGSVHADPATKQPSSTCPVHGIELSGGDQCAQCFLSPGDEQADGCRPGNYCWFPGCEQIAYDHECADHRRDEDEQPNGSSQAGEPRG